MPYKLSNLQHGVPVLDTGVGYVDSDYTPNTGEAVVSDVRFESRNDWVWDTSLGDIRPKATEDRLQEQKMAKLKEIAVAAQENIRGFYPNLKDAGPELWLSQHLIQLQQGDPETIRRTQTVIMRQGVLQNQINNANGIGILNAIQWGNQVT